MNTKTTYQPIFNPGSAIAEPLPSFSEKSAFHLYHTFSTENGFTQAQGSTDNLMDYSGVSATSLYKYQWDYIQDPQKMIGLLQGDEEGESVNFISSSIEDLYPEYAFDYDKKNKVIALFDYINLNYDELFNNSIGKNFDLPKEYTGFSNPKKTWSVRLTSHTSADRVGSIIKTLKQGGNYSLLSPDEIYVKKIDLQMGLETYSSQPIINKFKIAVISHTKSININKPSFKHLRDIKKTGIIKIGSFANGNDASFSTDYVTVGFYSMENKNPDFVFLIKNESTDPSETLESWLTLIKCLENESEVKYFIEKIISSNIETNETVNLNGLLENEEIFSKGVKLSTGSTYDIYVSRPGNFTKDVNKTYINETNEISKIFGYSGSFVTYTFANESNGLTNITIPKDQAEKFKEEVLELKAASGYSGSDILKGIRVANLNKKDKLDWSSYKPGLISPFNFNYKNKTFKVMISKGFTPNVIDPSINGVFKTLGDKDNAIGKRGTYYVYQYYNSKKPSHNYLYIDKLNSELLEQYLIISKNYSINIDWISQMDKSVFGECKPGCWPNKCCQRASLYMLGFTTCANCSDKEIAKNNPVKHKYIYHVAKFDSDLNYKTDYKNKSLVATGNLTTGMNFLKEEIKTNQRAVLIGVHYTTKDKAPPGNINKATYHYMVVVGYGTDENGEYIWFYDPGRSKVNKDLATAKSNKLYLKNGFYQGTYQLRTYTLTDIYKYN